MKKQVLLLVLFSAIAVFAVVAGGQAEEGAEADQTYTIVFNEPFTKPHTLALAAERFEQIVEERSEGSVQVEVHYGGSLGTSRDALEAVQVGTQTMVDAATAPVVAFEPSLGVLNLPYLFSSREQWYGVLDGSLGQELLQKLESQGFVGLAYLENGIRHVTNNTRPIYQPSDMENIKIRLMQNPVFIATFEELGALTTTTPWSELYAALQQGVVDAQENPVSNIWNGKLYEVQDYLSFTGHTYDPNIYFMNKNFYDSLPAEYQQIVREAAQEVAEWQREQAQVVEAELIENLSEYMEINDVSADMINAFRETVAPVYASQRDVIGGDIVDSWLDAVSE